MPETTHNKFMSLLRVSSSILYSSLKFSLPLQHNVYFFNHLQRAYRRPLWWLSSRTCEHEHHKDLLYEHEYPIDILCKREHPID